MRSVEIHPSGERVPVLGLGTWGMGERRDRRADEVDALRLGLDLGMTLIDTAEMYASGGAEEVVAEAIASRRADVFLVSKVLPSHATKPGTIGACEASMKRLNTDRIDLYLLHWRGNVPLEETLEAFLTLMRSGKIRYWGVSNFDTDDMHDLLPLAQGLGAVASTNQVLYNLMRRGIEWDLLPYCTAQNMPVMAYSPIEQSRLARDKRLRNLADRKKATPAQIALAWTLRQNGVIAIPKASRLEHVRENRDVLEIALTPDDLTELDGVFPSPSRKVSLEVL
ncbi:MAG: aldo/keto reductase [Vicinamibacterales bacterium]|nr:aldo/keto reductase [Vicinamibacterales bacterium]